ASPRHRPRHGDHGLRRGARGAAGARAARGVRGDPHAGARPAAGSAAGDLRGGVRADRAPPPRSRLRRGRLLRQERAHHRGAGPRPGRDPAGCGARRRRGARVGAGRDQEGRRRHRRRHQGASAVHAHPPAAPQERAHPVRRRRRRGRGPHGDHGRPAAQAAPGRGLPRAAAGARARGRVRAPPRRGAAV
ncbi:MAG: RuvC, partial [uncultured Gemmatimonadaceae bacterium]